LAYRLPNGSTFDFASGYSAPVAVTAISNATEAVVSAAGHDFEAGDVVVVTSGWLKVSGRAFRVKSAVAGTSFVLEGLNTTSTSRFPIGGSAGSVRKVTSWVQLAQIMDVSFTGGESVFYTFGFLEDSDERQIPTGKSAASMTLAMADDPDQLYVPVVEAADEDSEPRVQRLNLVNGDTILYNSIASFTSTPTLTRNELMQRTLTLSLQGRISRYSGA
jgi:hypothetical protein